MAGRDERDEAHDASRREFFRTFGRETVRNAGAVMGAASELRRVSGQAARDLLDPAAAAETHSVAPPTDSVQSVPAAFHSAYRLVDTDLLLLDQRELPARVNVVTVAEPTELASAIRAGVVSGGPVLGEVAAYALWATVARAADRAAAVPAVPDQAFRAALSTLRGARRDVHALTAAVDRMERRYDELTADMTDKAHRSRDRLADAMRAEADAIAGAAQIAHAAVGRLGARAIDAAVDADPERQPGAPINLLLHGDAGPLTGGMIGCGTALLASLADLGRGVHVWLTRAAPSDEGVRISAYQLTQLDVPHTVIADTGVGWLLSSRRLDGVVLRADTVAVNRDTVTLVGGLNVGRLAADAGVSLFVLAPESAWSSDAPDGASLLVPLRSPAEVLAATPATERASRSAVFGARLNPTADVVPLTLVTAFLTESGPRPGGRA